MHYKLIIHLVNGDTISLNNLVLNGNNIMEKVQNLAKQFSNNYEYLIFKDDLSQSFQIINPIYY